MDKKDFMETVKRDINETIARIFDIVDDISLSSLTKLKIEKIKRRVKNYQAEIGRNIFKNQDKYHDFIESNPEIKQLLDKIIRLEDEIDIQYERLNEVKEKEEKIKTKTEESDDKHNFAL